MNRHQTIDASLLLWAYTGMGNKDQAFVWLEKAFAERSNYLAYLKVFPLLDPLRSDPRFAKLVQRVGL